MDLSFLNHPNLWGTDQVKGCETCHMPRINGSLPVHLWRINASASYSTFPTALQFGIGGAATSKVANTASDTGPSGPYANAVWVDVDYACGQCHGGGTNSVDNPPPAGQTWRSKATLAARAAGIHRAAQSDLVISSISAPGGARKNTTITALDVTKNRLGGNAGASTTTVYLSTTCGVDTVGNPTGTIISSASRAVPALVGGASNTGSISLSTGANAGSRCLIWRADSAGVVSETLENNNTKTKAITITN
jgi:hypothetical protein